MKQVFIFFCLFAIIGVIAGSKYCSMPCKDYRTGATIEHIGCRTSNQFNYYKCPRNAQVIPEDNATVSLILHYHNAMRNYIAGGHDRNHYPAARMATMHWSPELAYLANLHIKQCQMKHDICHNTDKFQYSGQNIALIEQRPRGKFQKFEPIKKAIFGWYSEVENSTQSNIDSYPEVTENDIGHFTVMMADRNTHVGCAGATFDGYDTSYFLFTCNYATNNMIDHPIYAKSSRPGVHCKTGRNRKYTNLCSDAEYYAVNKWL